MSRQMLVIERDDQDRFVLAVSGGTLTIGATAADAEIVLRHLHVTRLHCEVEVDDELVVADSPVIGGKLQELRAGGSLHSGQTRLHFQAGDAPATPAAQPSDVPELALDELEDDNLPATPAPASGARSSALQFRFLVVDGADKGRHFALPETGLVCVGKSHKHADIVLNDLYVSRVHCELRIEKDGLIVRHVEGQNGTLVNGQSVKEQALHVGGVLRVGNTHMKLESFERTDVIPAQVASSSAAAVEDEEQPIEFQILEEESTGADTKVELAGADTGTFVLPHAPVDPLLELEDQAFGHFQIGKLLGRGQSGLVFRAHDHKTGHAVALKLLAADFPATEAELGRFVKAVKTASSLHHPSLVTVHSAGKTGAYCWLSREFIEGESLSRRVRRLQEGGKPDWKAACRVGLQLAELLEFLHGHKVAHGNLTPRNVLIRASDHRAKLADLMLKRALEGSKLQQAITAGKLLAELPYMAPEQTDPQAPLTPLGDIYSLGVVLYALLTGKPPFAGETPKAIVAQIHSGKVIPPSRLQRGVPATLDNAVLMMMSRRPEERFQSAADVLSALESLAEKHDIIVAERR
jgi:hypothetical protein